MSVKAKLRVILQADETVVAESDDAALWQRVLQAVNAGTNVISNLDPLPEYKGGDGVHRDPDATDAVAKFADDLGLSSPVIEGACAPSKEEPYMHLDLHCWEELKKQTPERGPTAYSPIAVASTLLTLWFRAAGLGSPTQAQAQAVLGTISITDRNPSRGIQRSEWLSSRPGGLVVLNPAQVSRAVSIAKAFCSKNWKPESVKK